MHSKKTNVALLLNLTVHFHYHYSDISKAFIIQQHRLDSLEPLVYGLTIILAIYGIDFFLNVLKFYLRPFGSCTLKNKIIVEAIFIQKRKIIWFWQFRNVEVEKYAYKTYSNNLI